MCAREVNLPRYEYRESCSKNLALKQFEFLAQQTFIFACFFVPFLGRVSEKSEDDPSGVSFLKSWKNIFSKTKGVFYTYF